LLSVLAWRAWRRRVTGSFCFRFSTASSTVSNAGALLGIHVDSPVVSKTFDARALSTTGERIALGSRVRPPAAPQLAPCTTACLVDFGGRPGK
jgi:hypothetical protein